MPELTINTDDIAAALRKHVDSFEPETVKAQVGRVLEVGDGIARVSGLPETSVNELLRANGLYADLYRTQLDRAAEPA